MPLVVLLFLVSCLWAQNPPATLVSTYTFGNSLEPARAGSPALTAANPQNQNRFLTDTVFGENRTVYEWGGAATNAQQGGLIYSGLNRFSRTSYTLELIMRFNSSTGFRRIIDLTNRTTNTGLYLNPANRLEWFAGFSGGEFAAGGAYNHIVVAVTGNSLTVYLNNQLAFRSTSNFLNANILETNNPEELVHLFLDNSGGSATSEWGPGRIALFRAYDGALTADQVAQIFRAPFASTVGTSAPLLSSAGVVNAASFSTTNPISASSFFTIFGSNLADASGFWGSAFVNNVAPRSLNGVRVLVQDQEAFIVFTSGGQLNVLAPESLPEGPVSLVVENNGTRSAPVTVQSRRTNPAFFRFSPNNNRYFASTANDGSAYIAPSNLFDNSGVLDGLPVRPAKPGEFIVLYGNGLGLTAPTVPGGQIPPPRAGGHPLASPSTLRMTSTDGAVTRTLTPAYAGLSGFPGLFQVVFAVPTDLPDGDYETVFTVSGISSPGGTFVPVRR